MVWQISRTAWMNDKFNVHHPEKYKTNVQLTKGPLRDII